MIAKTTLGVRGKVILTFLATLILSLVTSAAWANPAAPAAPHKGGGEANLIVPSLADKNIASFLSGSSGATLLMGGLVVSALGMIFGFVIYAQLKNAPVHKSMLEISELIYETCKTYLATQLKFIMILEVFIGSIIVYYFGVAQHYFAEGKTAQVLIILAFSLVGIAGSYGVAWFGIRVNTFANSRTAFAALRGKGFDVYAIPLKAGMSIGMLLISVELLLMLGILLFVPGDLRRPVLHRLRHRRVARRLGAPHRRRHLHQDRRHRLRPHEDRLQDQGRRRAQPRRHRRLHGRQRGRLGRPLGRRLRDLRRHRRRAHLVHPPRGQEPDRPGPAPRLDLRDAHRDGDRLGGLVLHQRHHREEPLRGRRQDELRAAAHAARHPHLGGLGHRHLRGQQVPHPRPSATAPTGGSSRRSSPAAPPPARSSPRSSRSSPRPSPATSRRSSPPPRRAALRSTSFPVSRRATSAPTGWA